VKSISGFNSSGYGSFGEGDVISASALNRMGAGIDKNRTMFSQGIEFQSSIGGVAFNAPQEVVFNAISTPFAVYLDTVAGVTVIRVVPGTVNNVIPYINGTLMTANYTPLTAPTTAGTYVVTIKCKADPAPAFFPKSDSEIKVETYPTTDTDTEGYITLAIVTATAATGGGVDLVINQSVSGSLWAERHKYTEPGTASYFFYRV
jgi:hypothetical protein